MPKSKHRKNRKPQRRLTTGQNLQQRPLPGSVAGQLSESLLKKQGPSRSRALQAVEALDGHAGFRNAIREIAAARGEWAGIPMPLEDHRLIVEPTYPKAKELMAMGRDAMREAVDEEAEPEEYRGAVLVNSWWSLERRCDIHIYRLRDGRTEWGVKPGVHSFPMMLSTLGASDAWGIEQESNAINTLAGMVKHRAFKQYMLTGMFLESSKRSGLTYCFRRLRPTVVMTTRTADKRVRILTTLCLHPIAYYHGSWAGAMCPTDDVISHLALMRGDEPMLWKRSNQHPPYRPEAGL